MDVMEVNENQVLREKNEQIEHILLRCGIYPWVYTPHDKRLSYLSNERKSLYPEPLTLDYFIDNYIHPSYNELVRRELSNVTSGRSTQFDLKVRMFAAQSKEEVWGHIQGFSIVRDNDGKMLRMAGAVRYITKEVRQEQELKESKDFLLLAMKLSKIIPWVFTLDDGLFTSKAPSRIEMEKPMPIAAYIDMIVHPDFRKMFVRKIDEVQRGEVDSLDLRMKVLSPEDTYQWVHVVGFVDNKNVPDEPRRMIGTCHNIDSEVDRELQLKRLHAAEEANRLKSAFLANMSHEIRTPLNAIVGFSQCIMESPEEAEEYFPIIATNTDLLLRLIDDILDISKIESGSMAFSFAPLDISGLLSTIVQVYAAKMPSAIELICICPDSYYLFNSDRNRLTQVLTNLLNNALKFTSQGSITIGYGHTKEGIRFFVRDTGKGISSENLDRVFERFTKLDAFMQGAGLGLSISDMIVRRLGGKMGVKSVLNEGSEFWFTIPFAENLPQ